MHVHQDGFRGAIKLICGEGYLPYDRIHTSKQLKADPALLRDAGYYAAVGIEVRSCAPCRVSVAVSNGGVVMHACRC